MSWLEVIHVRIVGDSTDKLLNDLEEQVALPRYAPGLNQIRLFVPLSHRHEIRLHLHWAHPVPPAGTPLGQRIAAGLRDFGPVHHSTWKEEE